MRRIVALLIIPVAIGPARPVEAGDRFASRPGITLHVATPRVGAADDPRTAAARAMTRGYLALDDAAYHRAKAEAARSAGIARGDPGTAPTTVPAPGIALRWKGLHDVGGTPSDSTGAIGATRYIEVVNSRAAIYGRTGALIATAGLRRWWNMGTASSFDPQVIWDPDTNRFYYAGVAVFGERDNEIAFGWSTTGSPDDLATSWCRYAVHFGREFPDYPKLGDSRDFALIGVNVYSGQSFRGADVLAIGKPAAGPDCPRPGVDPIPFGVGENLMFGQRPAFTPVPANQIDGAPTGYVIARSDLFEATDLGLFTVKRAADGHPVIQRQGAAVPVGEYSVPPNAPQADSPFLLDTLDGRLTQAVSARDPLHGGGIALWTQHTIAGGAGTIVRWYEIDPHTGTILQTGDVSDGSLFAFNGAISPDRVADGSIERFGGSMVLGFNTSSSTTYPAISMISKVRTNAQSDWVAVKDSPGPDLDFACSRIGFCRWGDYMAATPDPAAPTTASGGAVWLTGMWTQDGRQSGEDRTSWRTMNWVVTP